MAPRTPYNENTKYGRKKQRKIAQTYKEYLPEPEKQKAENVEFLVFIIVFGVIALIVFLSGGSSGLLKWLSH